MRATHRLMGATILMVASASHVLAQRTQAALSVSGGSATDVRGVTSRAVTVTPSLTFTPDARALFAVDASATRFDNDQWSAGGGGALALRAPLGRFTALTLNLAGNATTTSYDYSYVTAGALPAFEITAGPVSAYVGARGSVSTTNIRESSSPTTPLNGTPLGSRNSSSSTTSTSRSARGAVFGGNVSVASSEGETLVAGIRQEHTTIEQVAFIDRTASISVAKGALSLGGSVGQRSEAGASMAFGSGTLSYAVTPMASLEFAAGSYPVNRLVGTPAGRFVNVGVSLRTGRLPSPMMEPAGAPRPASGFTRLTFRSDEATHVEVAGDFTNWKPLAAKRAGNGVWFIDLKIPPGQYHYAFRVDGGRWRVPDGAAAVDDDFGGKSALLVVRAPGSTVR